MNGTGPELAGVPLRLAGLTPVGTMQDRAAAILGELEEVLPFDAGWLAVRDPELHRHVPVATTGTAAPLRAYFARPEADEEVDQLGLNRRRAPMLASDIPSPLSAISAWADHLLPAGFREGLAAGLLTTEGRHVGFLSLLSADPSRPNEADRKVVSAITTMIANELDRTREIADTARIITRAEAGVLLTRGGDVLPLPGLLDDRLLASGSPIVIHAADELSRSGVQVSFLVPVSDAGGRRLLRVTALDFARPDLDHLSAAVLLCPPGELYGLGILELQVLGHLIEGTTDVASLAQSLQVTVDAVISSLRRGLAALRTSDLTLAAVRALRHGTRIPPQLSAAG